jgi:hypothetical protein
LHHYFKLEQGNVAKFRTSLFWVLLIGVFGGLTTERSMLVIGIFSFAYALAAGAINNKKRIYIILFSILCILYVYIYMHYFSGTEDNARVSASLLHLSGLIDAVQRPGIGEYLLFNLALLVVPAVIAPRIFIAVLPIVAINCFVTVGGAEKNGWSTHYHGHYYGFLIGAFLVAVASINDEVRGRSLITIRRFLPPFMAGILLLFSVTIARYYEGQGIHLSLWDYYGHPANMSSSLAQKTMFDKLADTVPAGATVTGTEWGMAAWYLRGHTANIFPMGVGVNDYIMVQVLGEMPDIKLLSAVRYRADAALANQCYVPVLLQKYNEIAHEGTWALFEKKTRMDAL